MRFKHVKATWTVKFSLWIFKETRFVLCQRSNVFTLFNVVNMMTGFLIQVLYFVHCDLWFQRPIPGWWEFSQTLSLKSLKYTTVIRQFCRILVTPVSFTLWPCVMYCFHYFPVWLWCLLCIGTDSVSGFPPGVHTEHGTELRVFLLVCGLRRVKDPLYLVEDFSGISKNLSPNMTCRCCISIHAKTPDSREEMLNYREELALL